MSNFRSIAPPAGKITHLNYVMPDVVRSEKGTAIYYTEPKNIEVVKLLLYWPYGTRNQNSRFQARSALSLALNGSTELSAEEIQSQFDYWGASVGLDTGLFHSELSLKATTEYFEPALHWLLTHFPQPAFPESELENFRQTEVAALQRKLSTPRYWANRLGMEALFGEDNPNTRFVSAEHIQNVSREPLMAYHTEYLHPGNARWLLSGDITGGLRKTLEAAAFSYDPKTAPGAVSETMAPLLPNPFTQIYRVENTSQVSMFLCKKLPDIGETEYHLFSLLNLLLGGFFGSRLMQEIREEQGLTYGIGSYISQTTEGNIWCVSGEMNSANARKAEDATKDILRSMIENPPAKEELERAKRYYAGQFRASFDGPFSMGNKLKGLFIRGYGFGHIDSALESIWGASTEDLCRMADNYLQPETFHSVLAGDIS